MEAEKYQVRIHKATQPVTLDGHLDEPDWEQAEQAKDFFLNRPFDTTFATLQTAVRMTFDDEFLYFGIVCYEPRKSITVASLKRDFDSGTSDVVTINIDPFKDGVNGFHFAVSPYNVQREGLIDNGANISNFWDNRWYSQVVNYDDRWEAEIAVPFKTLRYKRAEGENSWRINFARSCLKQNEVSTWVPVPRNFPANNLAFTGLMVWDEAPPKPGVNMVVIPYLTGSWDADFPRNNDNLEPRPRKSEISGNAGLDVKFAVTPSLNLDLTVNPDFSQVEVDRQVTNLSRFELFFPERRQFFLENSDLFAFYGFPDSRPFFSRRIGLAGNPNTGLNEKVPIQVGARLSGKLNEKWRIGLLNMQTQQVDFGNDKVLPAVNYSVATAQYKVWDRSVLGGVFVNKQSFLEDLSESQREGYNPYNRVAGLEFNYFSKDNKWETETYYHRSFNTAGGNNAQSFAHFTGYNSIHWRLQSGYKYVGEDYQAEVGFVPRPGTQYIFINPTYVYYFQPGMIANLLAVGGGLEGNYTLDLKGSALDNVTNIFAFFTFQDLSEGTIAVGENYTYLGDADFDPTNPFLNPDPDIQDDYVPLPAGGYVYRRWGIAFTSSQRNDFSCNFETSGGQYFLGKQFSFDGSVGYRFQPYGNISLALSYNRISMPDPYNDARFYLFGPRIELTFTRSLFFSTFFQYNTQTNNVNINSRFQWRFRPVSDLFIVYTDNYFAEDIPGYKVPGFAPKNRALVLKLTYWFNL